VDKAKSITLSKITEPGPVSEQKTSSWKDYITLTKTGIVTSNFLTAFLGVWLASKYTGFSLIENWLHVLLALLGTTFVIAGGTSLNNYIDRDIDRLMPRTQNRPSADGRIPPNQVLFIGFTLSVIGVLMLLYTSAVAAILGIIGLVIYVVFYSMWTKRTTTLNTAVGAVSGAMPPLIGWATIQPELHPVAWTIFMIMFLWQMPHFFAISMMRCEDYRKAGIPMLPVVAGFEVTKRQMVLYVAALLPVTLILYKLGVVYTVIVGLFCLSWLILGIRGLKKNNDDLKWAKQMFVFSLNFLVLFVFVTVLVTI